MSSVVVETCSGAVRGACVATPGGGVVRRFLGVPYAAPPAGELRWRAPQPVEPWVGIRDADAFGPAAPQTGALTSALPGFHLEASSEDCLTLNVWTPSLEGTRAVMVWIHGGAYTTGGAAQPVYDAARLAAEGDVVVITINYRLGVLGFLAPDGDGVANAGLRDQLAALAWAREHAAAFGGDARRVTVFGESAGAGSILHLLASPRRGDAFDRAIVQSGEPKTLTGEQAADVAAHVARRLGLDDPDADALRATPVERLLDAQAHTLAAMLGKVGPMAFAPALDGDLLDLPIQDAFECGRARDMDLVLGTTRDELALFPDPRAATLEHERLVRRTAALSPVADPEVVVARYRTVLGPNASNGRVWDAVRTDAMMRAPNLRLARRRGGGGSNGSTFLYRFDWEAPGLGAAHGVDVPFTFGTFDREGWAETIGFDARAERLSMLLRRGWTAFAAGGNPGWEPSGAERSTALLSADGMTESRDADDLVLGCWMA